MLRRRSWAPYWRTCRRICVIEIDRLRLHLPVGFAHRAPRIARLVADRLARRSAEGLADRSVLAVRGVSITPALSDARVADRIAGAIHRAAGAGIGSGGGGV